VKRWLEGIKRHPMLIAVALYALVTFLMTLPLGLRLDTRLLSSTNDFWIYPWNNWWVKKSLTENLNVYSTPYLFYPHGAKLVWHGFSWFNTIVWLPLQPVLGSLAAHNVTILLTYVFAGWMAYLLAYEITGSRAAAFVAGLVYAFYPNRYAHRGQIKLLSNQWIPLVALCLVRLTRSGQLRDGLGLGIALTLCGLCGWHQLLLAGVWAAIWLLYSLATEHRRWSWRTTGNLLLAGLVCLILLAPLLVPMVTELARNQGLGLDPSTTPREKRTDLLAFLLPPADHTLFRTDTIARLYEDHVLFDGAAAAIGWAPLALAGWGALKRWKLALPWFLAAVLLAVLALGSRLQVNGRLLPIPLPYAFVKPTFLGTFLRHPNRFNIVLSLPISVLVSLGWQAARTRSGVVRRARSWSTLGVSLLILFEYCTAPVPTTLEPVSAFYTRLRGEEGTFAVADFPIDLGRDKYYLYVQTLHERPIVGGHVSRPPVDAHDFIDRVPILTAGREGPPGQGALDDVSRQLDPLAAADVRYMMIHKDRTEEADVKAWRRWFPYRSVYEDERVIAYRTEPVFGQDFDFVAALDDGIGIVAADAAPEEVVAGGRLEIALTWGTEQAPEEDWSGEVSLLSASGEVVDRAIFEPFEGWATSEWGSDALARRSMTLRVSPLTEEGRYRVGVSLVDGIAEPVIIDQIEVQGIQKALASMDIGRRVLLPFEEKLQFIGYSVEQHPQVLEITWHWQALRAMDRSYKLFLHIYGKNSGTLASQVDIVPHNWTYPTTLWSKGEIVSDSISMSLKDLPPGIYELVVGTYDAETGRRLSAPTTSDWRILDNAVVLEEIVIR